MLLISENARKIKQMCKIIFMMLTVIIFVFPNKAFPQSSNDKLPLPNFDKIVLPYKMVGDKMVVSLKVNDSTINFVFDTGGQMIVTADLQKKLQLTSLDSIKASDATFSGKKYARAQINSLKLGDVDVEFKQVKSLVLDQEASWLKCFDSEGTLGNEFFNQFIIELDSKSSTITLFPPTKSVDINLRNMLKFIPNPTNRPIISVGLDNGNQAGVLFDSGAGKLMGLSVSDYQKLLEAEGLQFVSNGVGAGAVGVSGYAAQGIKKYRYFVPMMSLGLGKIANYTGETRFSKQNLIGCELLNFGKVTIDYPKGRFYFEPFSQTAMDAGEKKWNFDFSINNKSLRIGALWGDLVNEMKLGDEVLKIDSEDALKTEWCDAVVAGFKQIKDKDSVTLTIKSDDKIKTIITTKK